MVAADPACGQVAGKDTADPHVASPSSSVPASVGVVLGHILEGIMDI